MCYSRPWQMLIIVPLLIGVARSQSIVNANSTIICQLITHQIEVILNTASPFMTDSTGFAIFANGTNNTCNSKFLAVKGHAAPPFPPLPTSVTYSFDECGPDVHKVYGSPTDIIAYKWTASMVLIAANFTNQFMPNISDVPPGAIYYPFSATCILEGHGVAGTGTGHISPSLIDPPDPQKVVAPTDSVQVSFKYQYNCKDIGNDTIPLGTPLVASAEFSVKNKNFVAMKPDRCFFAPSEPASISTYTSYALDAFDDGCPTGIFGDMGLPQTFTGLTRNGINNNKFEVLFNSFAFNNNMGDGTLSGGGAYLGYFCYFTLCPPNATAACSTVSRSTCWADPKISSNTSHCPLPSISTKHILDVNHFEELPSGAVRVLKKVDSPYRSDEAHHTSADSLRSATAIQLDD